MRRFLPQPLGERNRQNKQKHSDTFLTEGYNEDNTDDDTAYLKQENNSGEHWEFDGLSGRKIFINFLHFSLAHKHTGLFFVCFFFIYAVLTLFLILETIQSVKETPLYC